MEKNDNIIVKYYCPLTGNLQKPGWGDSEGECWDMDGSELTDYANEIECAIEDYESGDMAEYFDESESAANKLISAHWGVENVGGVLYGCITATLTEPFTNEEEAIFKDYIEGQNSDGLGEGFEQQEIRIDDGYLSVSYWHRGSNYFVFNEREFMKYLGKKQPYAFAYKDTEKCRNYWYHSAIGERTPIAFLELNCVDIELNLERDGNGAMGAYLFVCGDYTGKEWESVGYATSDVQEKLSTMTSWGEVEDFMYDELIRYCTENNIDFTKNCIEEKGIPKNRKDDKKDIEESFVANAPKKRCPKCGGETFYVNAHVVQGWLVDGNGDFVAVTEDCVEIAHEPDNEDIWTCAHCGYDDMGSNFENSIKEIAEDELPHILMNAEFRILERHGDGPSGPVYVSLRKEDISELSLGSFTFIINGKSVPFDFDDWSCCENLGIFKYQSGGGGLFNGYEISDVFDRNLNEIGISRKDLTAEFLASASKIHEFTVDFEDRILPVTDGGWYGSNLKGNPQFKVELISVSFTDVANEADFFVQDSVLDAFNKGV